MTHINALLPMNHTLNLDGCTAGDVITMLRSWGDIRLVGDVRAYARHNHHRLLFEYGGYDASYGPREMADRLQEFARKGKLCLSWSLRGHFFRVHH